VAAEGDSSKKIKVVDRRWFTDDGDPREGRPAPQPAAPKSPGKPQPDGPQAPEADAPTTSRTRQPTSQVFLELVAMLAQQAELLITGGGGLPRQPDQAQRLIEYLSTLEAKTRGNVSVEEEQILGNVVFQLRSMLSQASS